MELSEIKADENIIEWLDEINAQPNTRKNFQHSMSMYTDFLNMTPEELLNEADEDALLPIRKRKLKKHIIAFRVFLQGKGVSENTIRSRLTAIRSFYNANEILIPKIKFEKPKTIKENDKVPTKEDIQDCLSVCDPLEKAVMLTGISSGMAANEIRNLTLKQFREGYDPETEVTTISMRRQKTGVDFVTFLSPEASRAILEYLQYRDRKPKSAGKEKREIREKQHTSENSYLFILKNVPSEYLATHDEELRKMGENAMLFLYSGVSEKARKNTANGYNFIRSHTMRKYFNSCLLNAGCDSFHVEYWMGHKLSDTQAAYFRANIKSQEELYKKYIPYLTIQKELDVSASPEYISAIERAEKAEAEAVRVSVEREELNRVRAQLESMSASFDSLWNMYQQDAKQQKPEAEKGFKKVRIIPSDLEPSRLEDFE
ncbi:tyrosine-type recombinase/integrase [Methanosarcina mazei]|uniref:Site-specific integrase n=2 Tax=Methanosarcina mazei TaxID=2209 RepID=A0A6C0VHN5_METMZ|nr:site-specific integrase [Methanosarcina mazei]AKB61363.1 hypothetical protein MSMAP_1378 [Methanosarcina mazei SarPi]QIB90977.1 site-specific integrase [Methanosarcina mazei]